MDFNTYALKLKIIHWEYKQAAGPITDMQVFFKIDHVTDPETKKKKGFLFKFVTKFYEGEKIVVNCLAEEVFINYGFALFTFDTMKNLMQAAFNRFKAAFEEKMREQGAGAEITYRVKDAEVHHELMKIKKGL